ncbi:unnamed protein product [Closterium sp. NIES-53]
MDAEMASWKSTGTYVDEVPPPGANIVSGMWIFRGFDYFQTFSSTLKMTTLRVLLHVAAQRDYELHSLDFSTAFLQGSLHEEIWLRRPPGFTGSFPPVARHTDNTLAALGFAPSTADPSLFLRTDTSLPPFYILVYVDDLVFATADTAGLAHVKSELQKRHTCTDLGELRSYLGLQITRDRAQRTITLTQSHMVQQQRGQLRLAYVASQANTADIFTKALPPGDHQHFCTLLACFALLDWSCDLLFSTTLPMGGRPTEFSTWQRQATRYLTSQRQDGATLWAHASGALKAPLPPDPLPIDPEPTPVAQVDYDRRVLARDMWDSRNAAIALALTELLPPTEAVHFAHVDTAQGIWDAVVARYSTPSSTSLSRLLMPFVFPDLGSFLTVSDLVTHLRSLDAGFCAACTDAQLLVAPPPMWLTVHCLLCFA